MKRVKPRLRGWSHQVAVLLALPGAAVLVSGAPNPHATLAAIAYGGSLLAMFGVSALYHVPTWSAGPRLWLRRADHAAIFLLIAGSYTPFCLLLPPTQRNILLGIGWIGAAIGIIQVTFFTHAPRALRISLYLVLGWAAAPFAPALYAAVGPGPFTLLAAGGFFYSLGAVIYALRRPDPIPAVFGFHEIFHAMVVAAAACHFAMMLQVVQRIR